MKKALLAYSSWWTTASNLEKTLTSKSEILMSLKMKMRVMTMALAKAEFDLRYLLINENFLHKPLHFENVTFRTLSKSDTIYMIGDLFTLYTPSSSL